MPGGSDILLKNFTIDYARNYTIPLLLKIKIINPKLKIIASPWSAPAWMKNTDSLLGADNAYLIYTYFTVYAIYWVRLLQAFNSAGVFIDALTV